MRPTVPRWPTRVSGAGPIELAWFHWNPPIDFLSDDPGFVRVRWRLDTFSRTLWFDPRGMGASEGDPQDSRAGDVYDADLTALLDAAGFQRPALAAGGLCGPAAIHFAVSHPQRVSALVLYNTYAHYVREDDYPWGIPRKNLDRSVAFLKDTWGTHTGRGLGLLAPSQVTNERFQAWYSSAARFRGGPDQVAEVVRAAWEDDVRPLCGPFRVPPWSCTGRGTVTSVWARAATWPSTSPAPVWWPFPARIS
jgi:pimeloyl-ACP methyl ester carboxylesterase